MAIEIITELHLEDSRLLNTVADSQHVESSALFKCEISTTIKKIRYGTYKSEGVSHEACVIIFSFDIVGQKEKYRIEELAITFSVFRAPAHNGETTNFQNSSKALEIRLREPIRGRTAPAKVRKTTSFKIGGEIGYQVAGVNAGYGSTQVREISDWGALESHIRSKRVVKYRLNENNLLKDGVPGSFECALVLRTDGIPFSLSTDFEAIIPHLRGFWKRVGRANVLVGESAVRNGQIPDPVEEDLLKDMDSDAFASWLKNQTSNNWIAQ